MRETVASPARTAGTTDRVSALRMPIDRLRWSDSAKAGRHDGTGKCIARAAGSVDNESERRRPAERAIGGDAPEYRH